MVPKEAKKPNAKAVSLPAPIGGWNALDALGNMPPTDAVTLQNFWPLPSSLMQRNGYIRFATGLGDEVESLLSYSGAATNKLFGVAGTKIYDCSAGGTVGPAVVSSLSNARFQYVNISTAGGNFLLAVNGQDKLRYFDGTTWSADGGTYTISGFDTSNAININLFKTRIWLIQKNSLIVWYLGVNSIQGAAASLNFGGIARHGGYLVAMGTWTIDAGNGADDLAVFITSNGEVIVYQGTDPTSSTTWALVGVWQIGAPIGYRCFLKWMGDLLLITHDGVGPMSSLLQSSRVQPTAMLTNKIQSAMSNAATTYSGNFGWQLFFYAKANMLLLNVPVSSGYQEQYAMNTITKSWCDFQGIAANCWELFADEPYFGGAGFVGQFWNGQSDDGKDISTTGKQAFNYFSSRAHLKRFTMMKPVLLTNGQPKLAASLNIDFDDTAATSLIAYGNGSNSASAWDSALWDIAVWGGNSTIQQAWQGVNGIGVCAAPRLQMSSQGIGVQWISTDLVFETGAIL